MAGVEDDAADLQGERAVSGIGAEKATRADRASRVSPAGSPPCRAAVEVRAMARKRRAGAPTDGTAEEGFAESPAPPEGPGGRP